MHHRENTAQVAVGGDFRNDAEETGNDSFMVVRFIKQKNEFNRQKNDGKPVQGSHPPDIGREVGRNNVVYRHAERIFNFQADHQESGKNGNDRQVNTTFRQGQEVFHAEDMSQ